MIGNRIGNFLITRELPAGGMGRVYVATQLTLNRSVAIKVLRPELAESREHIERFRREADTLARLDHESIVRIFDVVEQNCQQCIVMEFVGGPSLAELLARTRRLAPAFARDVAAEMAGALAAAHGQGIIHRDLKPGNILFSTAGRPKLADFGIARIIDTASVVQSQLVGTPYYMSPEQVRGENLTPLSDVYSLGVVLYEMLSGKVPFDAETPIGVALKHVQEAPPSLTELAPELAPELCALIHRTLEKDARKRFRDADELQDSLQRLDLGFAPGRALRAQFGSLASGATKHRCDGCRSLLKEEFVTCPRCGRAVCSSAAQPAAAGVGSAVRSSPHAAGANALIEWRRKVVGPGVDRVREGGGQAATGVARWLNSIGRAVAVLPSRAWVAAKVHIARRETALFGTGILMASGGLALVAALLVFATRPPPPSVSEHRASPPIATLAEVTGVDRHGPAVQPSTGGSIGAGTRSSDRTGSFTSAIEPPPEPRSAEPLPPVPRSSSEPTRGSRPVTGVPPSSQPRDVPPRSDTPAEQPDEEQRENPGFDEAAASREIEAIIERQRRATESMDLALLLFDLQPSLHREVTRTFRNMQRDASSVTSQITNKVIRFPDATNAHVSFHAVVSATRRQDGQRITISDRVVVWRLSRSGDRWLIVSSS